VNHTRNSFRNLIKSNQNRIVFTIFRLILNQTDVRLIPNRSENCKYNPISVWFNKISKRFFYMKTEKTTPIRRIAVLETVSRHARGPDWGPPWNPPDHHSTVILRGGLNLAPIMPRDASLSDSGCEFFSLEGEGIKRSCLFLSKY